MRWLTRSNKRGRRGCRSRVDTRIYPGCRWCSLHLILVGEIDDIILHNSGLPRRPEAYSLARRKRRGWEKERGSRLAHHVILLVILVGRTSEAPDVDLHYCVEELISEDRQL